MMAWAGRATPRDRAVVRSARTCGWIDAPSGGGRPAPLVRQQPRGTIDRRFRAPLTPEEDPPVKRPILLVLAVFALIAFVPFRPAEAATKPSKAVKAAAGKPDAQPAVVDSVVLLERAVARDSSNWQNQYRLGVMLMDRDRPNEAMRALQQARILHPGDVKVLVNLGAAYDALGQAQNAQNMYNEALKATPGDTVATCRLASSLYSTGEYAKSMDLLRELVKRNPNAYCAYFTLGVAFADAGIYRDAIRMWEKVVAIAPTSPEALSAKESIDVLQRVLQTSTPQH